MSKIIKAGLKELEDLTALFNQYLVFYKKPSETEKAREFLNERISRNDAGIFLCVNDAEETVGFTLLYPLFSSTRMRKLWLLNDLFVAPHHRGMGYSKLLIEKAKELCRQTNAAGLILETSKENMIGNKLYPDTGFELDTEHNFYSWDND